MHLQAQIKKNASDIRSYVTDLYEWEQQKQLQQKHKKGLPPTPQALDPEPKVEVQPSAASTANQEVVKLKRDANTVGDYYKAWSQFDVDEELKKAEQEQAASSTRAKPYNPYENATNNIRAKPKVQLAVKGGRNVVVKDPTSLKDRGNLHFKSCQYQKAIECYTQCLDRLNQLKDPSNNKLQSIVLSNRAMTYLKTSDYAAAYTDCSLSIQLDKAYIKSYLRRGTALKKMKRFKQALKDYNAALAQEPGNTQAKQQAKRLEQHLRNQVKEAREALVKQGQPSTKNTYKVEINEVEAQQVSSVQQPLNYLEEL